MFQSYINGIKNATQEKITLILCNLHSADDKITKNWYTLQLYLKLLYFYWIFLCVYP